MSKLSIVTRRLSARAKCHWAKLRWLHVYFISCVNLVDIVAALMLLSGRVVHFSRHSIDIHCSLWFVLPAEGSQVLVDELRSVRGCLQCWRWMSSWGMLLSLEISPLVPDSEVLVLFLLLWLIHVGHINVSPLILLLLLSHNISSVLATQFTASWHLW